MNKRSAVAAVLAGVVSVSVSFMSFTGCVKEISAEERLERETARIDPLKSTAALELLKLQCDDIVSDLNQARDFSRSEEDRLTAYGELVTQLRTRTMRFEEAIARNPDLAFTEGSAQLVATRDGCVQASADVRNELETLVREIAKVLVVDDVRSGQNVKVARIDYAPLKVAIDKLELDDRESLLGIIANAERVISEPSGAPRRRK